MAALAKSDPRLAKRLALYKFRVPEELYDVAADPDCLNNLMTAEHRAALGRLRKQLERWMVKTDDPLLETFRRRTTPSSANQSSKHAGTRGNGPQSQAPEEK